MPAGSASGRGMRDKECKVRGARRELDRMNRIVRMGLRSNLLLWVFIMYIM